MCIPALSGVSLWSYLDYLEVRAAESKGRLSAPVMAALRHGWHFGDESFKDRLLALVSKTARGLRGKGNHAGRACMGSARRIG